MKNKTAALADLLSTTLFILPYEQGAGIAERYNAEVLWVDLDDVWRATAGYSAISQVMWGQ
ncbi:MAG: FAD:protein FMN transferase [Oscillospiraceae bacterium]|nr:FAD:protein FMN transferase [Oscillospiraceae bacterium]